ncbi:MAG: substrate-binding domain-containing protein [Actinobacteria bacterium]|nr:substrate-binding domain-containing protein [Actinomycetota bacterium]
MLANWVVSKKSILISLIFTLLLILTFSASCTRKSQEPSIVIYTTTSIYDSGLLDFLLNDFHSVKYKIVPVGTGEALKNAQIGNADLIITHAPELEKRLVLKGVIEKRVEIARNYYLLVGPSNDPAGVSSASSPLDAFKLIYQKNQPFVSRGDNSGTHLKEISVWKMLGINPKKNRNYVESGLGMAETLRLANEKNAYTLTDVATFSTVKRLNLKSFFFKDKLFENIYSVSIVSERIIGKERYEASKTIFDYLTSKKAAKKIREFSEKMTKKGEPPIFISTFSGGN